MSRPHACLIRSPGLPPRQRALRAVEPKDHLELLLCRFFLCSLAKCSKKSLAPIKKKAERRDTWKRQKEKRRAKPGREKLLKHLAHIFKRKTFINSQRGEEEFTEIVRISKNWILWLAKHSTFLCLLLNIFYRICIYWSGIGREQFFSAFCFMAKAFSTVFLVNDNSFKLLSQTESFNCAKIW